ncbi:MAG: hypothetical protein AB9836_04470 [Aminipila sp.]
MADINHYCEFSKKVGRFLICQIDNEHCGFCRRCIKLYCPVQQDNYATCKNREKGLQNKEESEKLNGY